MKQFACGSVIEGCQAVFRAPSNEDILAQVAAHAHRDHGIDDVPDEIVQQVRSHIVAVAA